MPPMVVPLMVALPLAGAAVSMALNRRSVAQRTLGLAVLTTTLVLSCWILAEVAGGQVITARMGGWAPDLGIVLVADPLAALMLVVSALILVVVLAYAIGSPGTRDQAPFFHPVYLTLSAGVYASFLTGDLFNLFVAFEVMLASSYVLITLGGTRDQVRHGMTYVVISLLASTLFITAVGLLYAATGTVNLAELAGALDTIDPTIRTALGLFLLIVFGIKAAIFPLFQWLPDSYPTAPSPVTAVFAGILTKVGVYAILRTQTLLFPTGGSASTVLLVLAGFTMAVGVLGAIAQDDVKRILSFHIISQIGYMIFGIGLFSLAGVAGAVLYIIHHIIVKTTLFLVAGIIEHATGTGQLRRLGGLLHIAPLYGVLFLLPALSLGGIPPLSGFVAKLSLVQAGFAADQWLIVAVSLAVGLLTLFSMTKIWNGVFWGEPEEPSPVETEHGVQRLRVSPAMVWSTAALAAASLVVAVAAGPLFEVSERAASVLLERAPYIEAVSGR
ncbi:MAG: Na+/H+ antiporter subunit D [Nitriliruptorales bacterium]|nr:Na+/H+ antiporter subunit D [Nitriliruptorales bacterium]